MNSKHFMVKSLWQQVKKNPFENHGMPFETEFGNISAILLKWHYLNFMGRVLMQWAQLSIHWMTNLILMMVFIFSTLMKKTIARGQHPKQFIDGLLMLPMDLLKKSQLISRLVSAFGMLVNIMLICRHMRNLTISICWQKKVRRVGIIAIRWL